MQTREMTVSSVCGMYTSTDWVMLIGDCELMTHSHCALVHGKWHASIIEHCSQAHCDGDMCIFLKYEDDHEEEEEHFIEVRPKNAKTVAINFASVNDLKAHYLGLISDDGGQLDNSRSQAIVEITLIPALT